MLVLTICATDGLVVPLSNIWTVNINLRLFYAAPSLYLFDRFCSKSCGAYCHNNAIIFPSHQFHLLITSVFLQTAAQISSRFAAFLHLFDRNQSALSFSWSFLPNRFLHLNHATSIIFVGVACSETLLKMVTPGAGFRGVTFYDILNEDNV